MNNETTYLHLAATGSEDQSEYECVFNEDVLVKKDSKIGLQSVSVNFNPNQIYIDGTNNFFFLAVGGTDGFGATNAAGATSIRGQLANGQYNATTLMAELTYQLNSTNTFTATTSTAVSKAEFLAITDTNNKVNIQSSRTIDDVKPAVTDYTVNGITVDTTGAQNAFSKTGTAAPTDYSYAIYNPFWVRSRGRYSVQLNVNTIGAIVGFVENIPDVTVTNLPIDQYYFAIQNTDGDYTVRYNGTSFVVPGIVPADNDSILFLIGEGKYKIRIVNINTGVADDVFEEAYTRDTYKQHLHGAISILDPAGECDEFRFTPSGFQLATIDGVHEITNVSEIRVPNYISNIGATPKIVPVLTLTLSNGLRDVLGYQVNTFASQKNPDSLVGVQNLELISFPNAILVELVNVPLNSFDAVSRRRKNILAFLPGLEQTSDTNNYYYVASEMVFINTKLYSDTLINSWRIRITDSDGDLISIDPGKMSINVVVISK